MYFVFCRAPTETSNKSKFLRKLGIHSTTDAAVPVSGINHRQSNDDDQNCISAEKSCTPSVQQEEAEETAKKPKKSKFLKKLHSLSEAFPGISPPPVAAVEIQRGDTAMIDVDGDLDARSRNLFFHHSLSLSLCVCLFFPKYFPCCHVLASLVFCLFCSLYVSPHVVVLVCVCVGGGCKTFRVYPPPPNKNPSVW